MAYADRVFVDMCTDIIENGFSNEGENSRAMWADTNEPAYTIKKFGVVNRYDLRKEFPILTLRPTGIKSATDELLWIYQKKSNNIKDLNSHIWDEWADKDGSIGKAYGYQIGKKYIHHVNNNGISLKDYPNTEYPSVAFDCSTKTWIGSDPSNPSSATIINQNRIYLDQMDSVIWDLRHNPFSRRIMTNTYNFEDLHEMGLYPCAYSLTFNCSRDKESGKIILNAILNQRSQDTLAANNWNVVQYSVLIHMLAQCCDMIAGELVHVISDCHIYDRHIPIIKELITREQFDAPKFWLNPEIKNFYDFTVNDIHLEGYNHGPQIKNIPIAV